MSSQQQTNRQRGILVAMLGASLGLTGCFQEHFGSGDGDDGEPGTGSTSSSSIPGESGSLPMPSTGDVTPADGSSTGEPDDDTTTGTVDESTGSTGGDDESSTSTGEAEDETTSTGEVAVSVEDLVPGDLVVTEVMYNPHCGQDDCEWVEILNTTATTVNLLDLYLQDTDYNPGNQGRVTIDLLVGPGEVAVIARGLGFWNYSFDADAIYGPNPGLNNGSPDRVVLLNSTEILDETALFFNGDQGVAWSLSGDYLDATSNDNGSYWCDATDPLDAMTTTKYGSPGVINPPC